MKITYRLYLNFLIKYRCLVSLYRYNISIQNAVILQCIDSSRSTFNGYILDTQMDVV